MQKLSAETVDETLTEATKKVFETMLSADVQLRHTIPKSPPVLFGKRHVITSSVGFSGVIMGMLYFYMEETVALEVAGRFLGMDRDELLAEGEETIFDTLGEFANMTVGSFKNRIGDLGFDAALTLPSIVKGIGLRIVNTNAEMTRFFIFEFEKKAFLAYLSLGYNENYGK